MIYKFALGVAIALLVAKVSPHQAELSLKVFSSLNPVFPAGLPGWALLFLRAGVGGLFLLHGYPKITHLREWSDSMKMPLFLCFLSAASMLAGGVCLILGLLTLLASLPILGSMLFAIYLDLSHRLPFVASDPYLIPKGQYEGPNGKGEPPSWEKAFMYCLMLVAIAVLGPGAYSLDALIFRG
jgi:putative oxidoreductase